MAMALDGIRVLDLSRLAPGQYGSMLLADFGADVVMVEVPPGAVPRFDVDRTTRGTDQDRDLAHSAVRRNKRAIAINLREPEGRELFYELARGADVVLDGFRPGVTTQLGIDYAALSKVNPRIITCTLSGYGRSGPYRDLAGHDINYIAIGGALGMIGDEQGQPVLPLNIVADFAAGGLMTAFAILLALQARTHTGVGQDIDLAMSDGVTSLLGIQISRMFAAGHPPPARGQHPLGGSRSFYNVYECADGEWVAVGAIETYFFEALCTGLGLEELIPLQHDPSRQREIKAAFSEAFKTSSRDEWFARLRDVDACLTPVLSLDEALNDPHVQERGMVIAVDDVHHGLVQQVGVAPKLLGTPGAVHRPSARRAEHTDELLRELGLEDTRITALRESGVVA